MSGELVSPYWYRVRGLKPRLRSHVRVERHHYRGERWYVLQDPASGRHHRLSPAAYYLVALMDGHRTVQDIWDAALTHLGDAAPSQGETIQLLAQMHTADVLRGDVTPDGVEMFQRFVHLQRAGRLARWLNPLSARIPLFDPNALLERWLPYVRPVFTRAGAIAWLLVVGLGALLAGAHAAELGHAALARVLDPWNLVVLVCTYPVVKALHELGHAFATKRFGGDVYEIGVMFLLFVPVPYVDASAASAFPSKRERMLVGAAGVMVELFLASLALIVWLAAEPGLVRRIAWDVMLIGGISTLVFNGNPLLRFDGYYVLADLLEIPNLAPRSTRHLTGLFQRFVLGLEERRHDVVATRGERAWFVGYGVASFLYRIALILAIAVFLASRFFVVGVVVALWGLFVQLALPLARGLRRLRHDPRVGERPGRVVAGAGAAAAAALLLAFVVPVPSWTTTQGVVWMPEHAQVRVTAEGFVVRVLAEPGTPVAAGQPLVEVRDPLLRAQIAVLEARLEELRARYHLQRQVDLVAAELVREEIATVSEELSVSRRKAAEAIVRSPSAGGFVLPFAEDLPGRFVQRGEVLGYVASFERPTVRALVRQSQVALVRQHTRAVEVRLADRPGEVLRARVEREVPTATRTLPSVALGAAGGGPFEVVASDPKGLTTTQRVFQIDLSVPEHRAVRRIGGRVFVRFEHDSEPIARRGWRALRRLFLGRFGV